MTLFCEQFTNSRLGVNLFMIKISLEVPLEWVCVFLYTIMNYDYQNLQV